MSVCDVSVESIKCWDPTGNPSTFVEDIAKKEFEKDYQAITLRYKKRNRLIIVRHTRNEDSKALFNGELLDAKGERIREANAVVNTQVAEDVKLLFKAGARQNLGNTR